MFRKMSAVPMIDVTQEVVVKRVTPREVVHPRSAILDKDNKVNVVSMGLASIITKIYSSSRTPGIWSINSDPVWIGTRQLSGRMLNSQSKDLGFETPSPHEFNQLYK